MTAKQDLRRAIRADRAREAGHVVAARAQAMAAAASELSERAAGGVAAFQPTNAEPDVGPLLRALAVPVFVPRLSGGGLEWVPVAAAEVTGMRSGIPRPDGAAVATGAALVTELGVRLLLVPALAVDPVEGTRLGYGAGWYDRLLAEVRHTTELTNAPTPIPAPPIPIPEPPIPIPEPVEGSAGDLGRPFDGLRDRERGPVRGRQIVAVGVCRAADLVSVPREPHDEPLDGVLTEQGLVWFAARV